jgi:uncharacterized repeat protein (TIGR04042 family)
MPELRFRIRWPDATEQTCYSPSTVIKEHFTTSQIYDLPDFLARCHLALHQASDRVQARYGMPCSRALGQLADIEHRAMRFSALADAHITVLGFNE